MRNDPSDAEHKLWYFLRGRQLANIKFRRQAPIRNYIVDFVSFELNLVIELDGGQHAEEVVYDERRTAWLNSQGFQVRRFWNNQVLEETEYVVEFICRAVAERRESIAPTKCKLTQNHEEPPP
jgi:very-short-patch-repair endonuclease